MTLSVFLPSQYRLPSGSLGPTVVGGATALAVLTDSDNATFVHVGTTPDGLNHNFVTINNPGLPTGRKIHAVAIQHRMRFLATVGWIYPVSITGIKGSERHTRTLSSAAPGAGSLSVLVRNTEWTTGAADGTPWDECTKFETEWSYQVANPEWPAVSVTTWDSSNYPQLNRASLYVDYSVPPAVYAIAPTGTVTVPQPTLEWAVTDGPQTAFQLVLVPVGSVDSASVVAGAANFDPTTGSGMAYDSGKVYSASGTHFPPVSLTNGVWYVYIRAYTGSGSREMVSAWSNAAFTVDVDTVDQPTVFLEDDTASNTVKVTIVAGYHTEDQVATTIEVQQYDPDDGWVAASIADSSVAGTGSSVFFDGLRAPGASISYRARGIYVSPADDLLIASPWATATHTVGDLHQWWLRSTTDYTLNRSLHNPATLLVKDWKPQRARPQAVTWGVGARAATVVHDITKGDQHSLTVWCMTKAAYDSLLALIQGDDDLMLVSEWGEAWRMQVGDRISEEIVRAAPRSGELTPLGHVRQVSFTLTEVVQP